MNALEQQLWDYIDGHFTAAAAQEMAKKIKADAEIEAIYLNLLVLHANMQALEIEEPSMAFNRRLMDSLADIPAPVSLKTQVNKKIISALALFFIGVILLCSMLLFSQIKLSNPSTTATRNWNMHLHFSKEIIYALLFVDVVAALIWIDFWLRNRFLKGKV